MFVFVAVMTTTATLTAPFPYFGGKRRAADVIWARLGDVRHYIEPFAGSMAVLLRRPSAPHVETANDINGLLTNFWRAVRADPQGVAEIMGEQMSELDLVARNNALVAERARITDSLRGDPEWFDVKAAGWWGFCAYQWIASGLTVKPLNMKLPVIGQAKLSNRRPEIDARLHALSARLREVRLTCGDWSRVLSPAVLSCAKQTGILLDPPYSTDVCDDVYSLGVSTVSIDVRNWCAEHGSNHDLRIALCGYQNEGHGDVLEPLGWTPHHWRASGGYGNGADGRGKANAARETIWFSPGCLPA